MLIYAADNSQPMLCFKGPFPTFTPHTVVISSHTLCKQLTNNNNSDHNTITSNRISYSTCVCSTITCSNTINGVVSMEHCTSTSMIHCSDTSGL